MKLCKDCRHYAGVYFTKGETCGHPDAEKHPIHGAPFESALDSRGVGGRCGPGAKLFDAKPPEAPKKLSFFKRIFG